MKKWLAIILCSAYFVATTPLVGQLLKLPILFEHFEEHKALDESLSFWSYMHMHYFDDTQHGDWTRDNQLPFKQINNGSSFVSIAVLPQDVIISEKNIPCILQQPKQLLSWTIGHTKSFQNNIFQPPRVC